MHRAIAEVWLHVVLLAPDSVNFLLSFLVSLVGLFFNRHLSYQLLFIVQCWGRCGVERDGVVFNVRDQFGSFSGLCECICLATGGRWEGFAFLELPFKFGYADL